MSHPTGYQVEQAMAVLMAARRRLLAEEPGIESDYQLFADMLEGFSGDAMTVIERVIRASVEADGLADAAKERRAAIADRQARFERRRDALRGMAFAAMDALGLPKMERGDFTASIRAGQPSVVITDETRLPAEYVRVKREPDKALISAAIKAGKTVDGAVSSNSLPVLSVRVR